MRAPTTNQPESEAGPTRCDQEDQEAQRIIEYAQGMAKNSENAVSLIDEAITYLGGTPGAAVEPGPPHETVMEHVLAAVRESLSPR